jgi:two-component system response regulator VicR
MLKTVLIIEDDLDILDLIKMILQDEGYQVICATDQIPLQELKAIDPALILLDNRLTCGSGEDFCKTIKTDASTRHFTVVLCSANTELIKMAQESSADGYLAKPFDLEELIALVKRFAEQRPN